MEWLSGVEAWLLQLGPWGLLLAPGVMATIAILPIPAEAPALMNGMLFGAVVGSLVTWSGALLGAWISFELARRFGRPLASRALSARALRQTDRLAERMSWPGLLGLRLLPLIAFTVVNWGAGLTTVPRGRFLWTTAVGILPGAVVFTASGAGIPWLLEHSPGGLVLSAIGLSVVAAALWAHSRMRAGAAPGTASSEEERPAPAPPSEH